MRADYGNEELNKLIETLRGFLCDYLIKMNILPEDYSVEKNEKFCCINPEHQDNNPSMQFITTSGGKRVRCWSCGKSADIFDAAVWLEGLPADGKEWITENVHALAAEFELDFVEYEPSQEEMYRAKIYSMLADAADVLTGLTLTSRRIDGMKHLEARGITRETAKLMQVGTVDWDEFCETMKSYGEWEKDYLIEHGKVCGLHPGTFGEDYITITLKDIRGIVFGFDRRYVKWNKEDERSMRKLGKSDEYPKKWLLPRKSDFFNPETFLYGLDRCKERSYRQLDIVEGYFDALSGIQAGHQTIVACCGVNGIKEAQMKDLISAGFEDICIVFDSDLAGKSAAERYLKMFGGNRQIRLKFRSLEWPADLNIHEKDKDPDSFFRLFCKQNLEAYEACPSLSSFRVLLNLEEEKGTEAEELARKSISVIAAQSDPIVRGKMIKEVSEMSKIAEADVRAAVDQILSGKAANISRDLRNELQRLGKNATPQDIAKAVKGAEAKLTPLYGGSSVVVTSRAAKANFFEALDAFDNDKGVLSGWRTDIPMIDEHVGGVPKKNFWVIGGNPQNAKSAFMHAVVHGVVKNWRENKDVVTVLFSFDDTTNWTWAKQIALETGFPIQHVARPQKYIYHDVEKTKAYKRAIDFYREIIGNNLRVFGGEIGMSIDQMHKAIEDAQQTTGKNVLVVLDSFNKLQGIDGLDGVAKYEKNADALHEMMHNGMSVICTAEAVKASQGRKPTQGELADTKRLSYNATMVSIMFNPLHELREKSNYFYVTPDPDEPCGYRKDPVVQIEMVKNKITKFDQERVFKLAKETGRFTQIQNIHSFMAQQQALWNQHGSSNALIDPKAGSSSGGNPFGAFSI